MDARHNDPQTPHERARLLASDRLDGPLDADGRHLARCSSPRLRRLSGRRRRVRGGSRAPPFAAAAGASARSVGPHVGRARSRASDPVEVRQPWSSRQALSAGRRSRAGMAVLLIGVVVGRSLLSPISPASVCRPPGPDPGPSAGQTPMAVTPGSVAWAAPGANGSYTVNVATVDAVCPQGPVTAPGCASLDAGAQAAGLAQVEAWIGRVIDPEARSRPRSSSRAPRPPVGRSSSSRSAARLRQPGPAHPHRRRPRSRRAPRPRQSSGASPTATADGAGSPSPTPSETPDASPSDPTETPEPTESSEPSPSAIGLTRPDTNRGRRGAGDHRRCDRGRRRRCLLERRRLACVLGPAGRRPPRPRCLSSGASATRPARPLTTDHATVFSDWVD